MAYKFFMKLHKVMDYGLYNAFLSILKGLAMLSYQDLRTIDSFKQFSTTLLRHFSSRRVQRKLWHFCGPRCQHYSSLTHLALEKNGQILNGNVVTLKIGEENAELPFQQGDVIVVQNFKVNDPLPQIRERLRARFVQCGQIKELFLPENLNLQNDKGTAYIEFAEYDGFKKAFHRQYADPLPGDSKRLSIITPKFEEVPFLSSMGGGRGGNWGYKDDNGYIEDDLPEDPTRSLLPIATDLFAAFTIYDA
ncbi:hypothetical protein LguiB_005357 [Lonicera macranthoides]